MNNDSISRQAAIAYAISGRVRIEDGENWIRTEEVKQNLLTMPSALVRCRDCQWYSEEHRMCTEHGIEDRDDSGYCSDGVQRKGENYETDRRGQTQGALCVVGR